MAQAEKKLETNSNQIVIHQEQVDLGPYRQEQYDSLIDEDLTTTPLMEKVISLEMQGYLNEQFPRWRLFRRVVEKRRHAKASPYKLIYYVLSLDTDADAINVASHLKKSKSDFGVPTPEKPPFGSERLPDPQPAKKRKRKVAALA